MKRIREVFSRSLRPFADFLRGFVGATPLPRDPAGVRRALEQRARGRKSCC